MDDLYWKNLLDNRIQHLIDAYYEGKRESESIPFEMTYGMLTEVIENIVSERIEERFNRLLDLSSFKTSKWEDNDISKALEDIKIDEAFMLSWVNTERAKHKRPKRQHPYKSTIKEYWNKWQSGEIDYKNNTDFVAAMMDKSEITRPNTIREWISEWKANLPSSRLDGSG